MCALFQPTSRLKLVYARRAASSPASLNSPSRRASVRRSQRRNPSSEVTPSQKTPTRTSLAQAASLQMTPDQTTPAHSSSTSSSASTSTATATLDPPQQPRRRSHTRRSQRWIWTTRLGTFAMEKKAVARSILEFGIEALIWLSVFIFAKQRVMKSMHKSFLLLGRPER